MPRYFFNFVDVRTAVDRDGMVFESANDLKTQALRTVGEILSRDTMDIRGDMPWMMAVADETGKTVMSFKLVMTSLI